VRFDWRPTPGRHTLRFEADVDGQVPDLREDNNSASVEVRVEADLEVSGIDFTSPPTAGVRTTAVARLTNVGRAPSGGFNVKWFLDGVQVGYGRHASLAPGQISHGNVRFDWRPTPGRHTLRFEADVDHLVPELREDNNSAAVEVRIEADLEVSGISFTSPPVAGRRTTAVARLANVGRAPSGVFNVKWFLDGAQVGYGSHASLAPGEISRGNVRFDWRPTRGRHTLRFEADVDDQVQESDETNNAATVTVVVR
jgi:subtilase family serine protease